MGKLAKTEIPAETIDITGLSGYFFGLQKNANYAQIQLRVSCSTN
jgi:hypothetical protein